MAPHLTLDDISLSEDFSSPSVKHRYLMPFEKRDNKFDKLEYFNGMKRGESRTLAESDSNTVECRPGLYQLLEEKRLTLTPTIENIQKFCKLLRYNAKCQFEKRRHVGVVFRGDCYEFILTPSGCSQPIYVRDSSTGLITRHDHPFPELPILRLPLHPSIWAVQSVFNPLLNTAALMAAVPPKLSRLLVTLQIDFPISRPPLDFFYDGCALGDFPSRALPYEPCELGVPKLSTSPSSSSRKRTHPDGQSAADVDSEAPSDYHGPYDYPEDVDSWVTLDKDAPLEDLCLEDYAKEPSVPYWDATANGDAWRLVRTVRDVLPEQPPAKKRCVRARRKRGLGSH